MRCSCQNVASETVESDEKTKAQKLSRKLSKSYASKLLKESTIAVVSNIFSTNTTVMKICMTLVFFSCISGFMYQCITFMNHVLEYPTTIDFEVQDIKMLLAPAITFCNNNMMKKSLFCSTYPDYCFSPSQNKCFLNSSHCNESLRTDDLIPKIQFLKKDLPFEVEEFLAMSGNYSDILMDELGYFAEGLNGPFMRLNSFDRPLSQCYSMNSVASTSKPAKEDSMAIYLAEGFPIKTLRFYIDPKERFYADDEPGLFFVIHSPYEEEDPVDKGIFMNPGKLYTIFLTVSEEIMLKEPYRTNCTDYEEMWRENNRTGPRSKSMCILKCRYEFSMRAHTCSPGFDLYPSNKKCRLDLNYAAEYEKIHDKLDYRDTFRCKSDCRNECNLTKYQISVVERRLTAGDLYFEDDISNTDNYIKVKVYLGDRQIITRKHSPKYLTVEVFSAIGGFIGCWLGISLMDITDVFMRFTMITRHALKKTKKNDSETHSHL